MKIIFMRHGESEYNVKGILNNEPKNKNSSLLTERGKEQARISAEKLKARNFEKIFCSEFIRTKQTAEIANEFHGVELLIDRRINEVHCGFEGESVIKFDEARRKSLEEFEFKFKGKESWNELRLRVGKFLRWLKKQDYSCVLIVSHQWTIGAMMANLNNWSNEEAMRHLLGLAEFVEIEN